MQMSEYFSDYHRVFNTGNDVQEALMPRSARMRESGNLEVATAFTTGFNVDKVN